MNAFESTSLWRRTLAEQRERDAGPKKEARDRLRHALFSFRKRAETLASEIPLTLRTLTVHDIGHIDALWEMANLIVGPDYPLNPAEAFILGGAFLLHDLGHALAAFPRP